MIEDCIEALNRYRESKGLAGYYVLHKFINTHTTFKVYKKYNIHLYFIDKDNKELILESAHQDRVTDEDKFRKDANIIFMSKLYKLIEDGIK